MTINNLDPNQITQTKENIVSNEDRTKIEIQEKNIIELKSEKEGQKNIQEDHANLLKEELIQKEGINSKISEPRNFKEMNPNELMKIMDHVLVFGTVADLENLLNEGIDIDQTDFQGRTALQMYATKRNRTEAIEMLINRGANINHVFMYQDRIPFTALDGAIQTGKTENADILRKHGAKTGKEVTES
ncbi:MAG: ankyrin repeat domain-containing protein [Candidatus Absconditabacterales bacterium]